MGRCLILSKNILTNQICIHKLQVNCWYLIKISVRGWSGLLLSPSFWCKQSMMNDDVHLPCTFYRYACGNKYIIYIVCLLLFMKLFMFLLCILVIQSSIIKQGDSDFSEIYIYNQDLWLYLCSMHVIVTFKLNTLLAAKIISFLGRDNLVIKIQLLRS